MTTNSDIGEARYAFVRSLLIRFLFINQCKIIA
jgi:hypothetical protein